MCRSVIPADVREPTPRPGSPAARSRRRFLKLSAIAAWRALAGASGAAPCSGPPSAEASGREGRRETSGRSLTLFLCGDVMTGRGIDQALPHPSAPEIHERYLRSAADYVKLAETANGAFARPLGFSTIWGAAHEEWGRVAPDLRIVNLETSVTTSHDWLPKGINYRMHPANVPCLTAAGIDCCALANNHVLDWGPAGLLETLDTLREAKLASAGAGRNAAQARRPAVLDVPGKGRVIVFAFGTASSGIPTDWAATADGPGVDLLPDLSEATLRSVARRVRDVKREGDIVVASIHWGANWGYDVPPRQRSFAHGLVDVAGVDVVHGHSSHHAKGIEVRAGRPILYGCGDFISDYEGIRGRDEYRDDLVVMYFPTLAVGTGRLVRFRLTPLRLRRFRLVRPSRQDFAWLRDTLARECGKLGTSVEPVGEGALELRWT